MNYLKRVLGINVKFSDAEIHYSLPNFIYERYRLQEVFLDGIKTVFAYPQGSLDPISSVKKHIERIGNAAKLPAVLILENVQYRQKEALLQNHIPFVVDGKQIYLPFLAVYLQERCDGPVQKTEKLLPSAQLLLLYFIYHGCGELATSTAAEELGFTPTSISRASRQLDETGLVKTRKKGIQKIISADIAPKDLFFSAKEYFCDPVKRVVYVARNSIHEDLLFSSYSALSEYSTLNPPAVPCFASKDITKWTPVSTPELIDAGNQFALELWRYDPGKLSEGNCVDPLSLALSLRNDQDERVETAVEEMLEKIWEE